MGDARKLQESYGSQMGIPTEQLKKSAEEFIAFLPNGYFEPQKGLHQEFLQWELQAYKKAQQELENSFNFQNLRNVEISQKGRLQQAINYYTALLKKYGFNEKNDLITVLFKDNQVGQLIGSNTALQLALQDLTSVEKKQLDGLYNLPGGATAFVPLQAGQLLSNYTQNQQQSSNIDYGNFPTPAIERGNSILEQINNGINKLSTLYEKGGTAAGGLASDFPQRLKAGKQPYYTYGEMADFDAMQKLIEQNRKKQAAQTLADNPELLKMGRQPNPIPQGSAANINITPGKIETTLNANLMVRLDGRILWNSMKKYAQEDYIKFSRSTGSSNRQSTNVI